MFYFFSLWLYEGELIFLHIYACLKVSLGLGEHNLSQSAEYRLRRALLDQYDQMVRPVLKPSEAINVTFKVDFKALSEVVRFPFAYMHVEIQS